MRKIFLLGLASFIALASQAQKTKAERKEERRQRINAMIKQEEEGVIAYHKHTVFGIKLASDGYGAFMEIGRAQSVKKAWLFQLDIGERKSHNEEKRSRFDAAASPYIFGKQNFIYTAKLGVQQQLLLGNKSNKNGVAVTANYGGGLSMAFLRPYYVLFNDGTFVKYESADSLLYLANAPNIIGGPGLGKGWNETKVNPGAYLKGAFRFDYGRFNELVGAVEVGICAEYYSKEVVQMIFNKPKHFFFSGYVTVVFGKRK